jgi:hypothetical protein
MKLKTKDWPEGRNWPDAVVLDVGSNMPHDVYGLADNGAGVRYVRHDIARSYFDNSIPHAEHMAEWHKLKAAIGAPNESSSAITGRQ